MTTPRAHADLAKLYFSDSEMGCWMWNEGEKAWQPDYDPSFNHRFIYHVGKTAPTEPPQIMCELAGAKFPMPAQEPLETGDSYFFLDIQYPETPNRDTWSGHLADERRLNDAVIQLSEEGAIKQARALRAAILQAVEKAREQMK